VSAGSVGVMNDRRHDWKRWDGEIVWHAFTQMAEYEPLIIERARGCTLIDVEGRELLDGAASMWCNVHGHRHPRLDEALAAQLGRVAHVTNLGMSNPPAIELATRIVDLAPPGLAHVFFSDSGAAAVEVALKIAFQYFRQRRTGASARKSRFVAFADAYHGDTLGAVSVGGIDRFNAVFQPLLFECIRLPIATTYRLPTGVAPEAACEHYARQLESVLAAHHAEIAAVIIEPLVYGAAGMVTQPAGFLGKVRELTRRFDVLLIADEVAVGCGRTGKMFACEHEGVTPDLLCLGKGLSGGYLPVAATLATTEVYNAFLGDYAELRSFFHGHTYGGNALGCAAALASLDVFDEEHTLASMPAKIERLGEHLARLREHPHVGDVRQRGLMAGVELVLDRASKTPYPWQERRGAAVCRHALSLGVWLRPLGDVIPIVPALSVSLEELDRICLAVQAGIERVL
jgi:adenosylmethionine-8-amino-7-oxononanoate aminotransferase